MGTHPIFESDFDCLTEEMVKRKSATRRNKSFKAVDPFAKGKSSKGLGTDQGFDYGGRAEIGSTKMLKKSLKGQKNESGDEKEEGETGSYEINGRTQAHDGRSQQTRCKSALCETLIRVKTRVSCAHPARV